MDQRTINVVLVYEIDVKGFGIFDQKLIVKQTPARRHGMADTEGVKLSDVASKTSAWQKSEHRSVARTTSVSCRGRTPIRV